MMDGDCVVAMSFGYMIIGRPAAVTRLTVALLASRGIVKRQSTKVAV
jgi:hypothetical protein